ncbi:hypothetical protein Acsp06_36600 [Actinomycetospora sp. NBRC 106375]|nr:hypothetical protein Acsp06_36600 [Actinomycetospora sp. NBRC 106375]
MCRDDARVHGEDADLDFRAPVIFGSGVRLVAAREVASGHLVVRTGDEAQLLRRGAAGEGDFQLPRQVQTRRTEQDAERHEDREGDEHPSPSYRQQSPTQRPGHPRDDPEQHPPRPCRGGGGREDGAHDEEGPVADGLGRGRSQRDEEDAADSGEKQHHEHEPLEPPGMLLPVCPRLGHPLPRHRSPEPADHDGAGGPSAGARHLLHRSQETVAPIGRSEHEAQSTC